MLTLKIVSSSGRVKCESLHPTSKRPSPLADQFFRGQWTATFIESGPQLGFLWLLLSPWMEALRDGRDLPYRGFNKEGRGGKRRGGEERGKEKREGEGSIKIHSQQHLSSYFSKNTGDIDSALLFPIKMPFLFFSRMNTSGTQGDDHQEELRVFSHRRTRTD